LRHEPQSISLLVLEAALEEELERLVGLRGVLSPAERDLQIQSGEMGAGKALGQVRRTEDQFTIEGLHQATMADGTGSRQRFAVIHPARTATADDTPPGQV
jgi:hypothetical protein